MHMQRRRGKTAGLRKNGWNEKTPEKKAQHSKQ